MPDVAVGYVHPIKQLRGIDLPAQVRQLFGGQGYALGHLDPLAGRHHPRVPKKPAP